MTTACSCEISDCNIAISGFVVVGTAGGGTGIVVTAMEGSVVGMTGAVGAATAVVSHETIYQSIFVQGRGALRHELHVCLRSGRAMRRNKKWLKAATAWARSATWS